MTTTDDVEAVQTPTGAFLLKGGSEDAWVATDHTLDLARWQ